MYSIEHTIEIQATPGRVMDALTTRAGIEGWWTTDTDVLGDEMSFRFGKQAGGLRQVRFRVDKREPSRLDMVCIAESTPGDWLNTRLSFELELAGKSTRVKLVHAGYPAKNENYEMCTKGWAFFLGSLASYLETGKGEPHARATQTIDDAVEIAVPADKVLAALTTSEGIAAWWTPDNRVTKTEHVYAFGAGDHRAEHTFRVERQDARGLALVCIDEKNGIGWLGTRLAFALEPAGKGTRVALTHAGYPVGCACYAECIGGWKHFLGSLKAYLETGTGTPHVPGAAK